MTVAKVSLNLSSIEPFLPNHRLLLAVAGSLEAPTRVAAYLTLASTGARDVEALTRGDLGRVAALAITTLVTALTAKAGGTAA